MKLFRVVKGVHVSASTLSKRTLLLSPQCCTFGTPSPPASPSPSPAITGPLIQLLRYTDLVSAIIMKLFRVVKGVHVSASTLSKRTLLLSPQCCTFGTDVAPSDPSSKPKSYKYPEVYAPYGPRPPPSDKILQLADCIAALPPEELKQIGPALLFKLKQPKLQSISSVGFSMGSQAGGGTAPAKAEEKKAEKTAFEVKLEKFDAAAKIKVIKEVRTFTNLGLKEAKELVEKSPVVLKQGVTKEEATEIIEKLKAAGGIAVME